MATMVSQEYLAESRQPNIYAAEITTYAFALLAVSLRFWSRRIKAAGYWIDDWLILVAMLLATGMLVTYCWMIVKGYGKHFEASGPNVLHDFLLNFFVAFIWFTVIIAFVKYSILALYWRVFGRGNVRWPVWTLTAVVTAWGIAVLFATIFACVPPKAFWDKSITDATCGVDETKLVWGLFVPNILTDVILLLVPIPHILKLNVRRSQKQLVIGTFVVGGLVLIVSILRFAATLHQGQGPDLTWNWVTQGILAAVENNLAIVSACLPTLRPVWIRVFKPSRETSQSSTSGHVNFHMRSFKSDPSSKRSRRRMPDESLLDSTIDSHSAMHPFSAIPDGSGVGRHEGLRAPTPSAYTKRATLEGYELGSGNVSQFV